MAAMHEIQAAKQSRRADAMQKVLELLTSGPMSCFDLCGELGIAAATMYDWLHDLQIEGKVYQQEGTDVRGRKMWALDSNERRAAEDRVQADHAKRCWRTTARQIGMQRDPLVAALFGPRTTATTKDTTHHE